MRLVWRASMCGRCGKEVSVCVRVRAAIYSRVASSMRLVWEASTCGRCEGRSEQAFSYGVVRGRGLPPTRTRCQPDAFGLGDG
eukprot:349712-Chlamydomonas_euryale.AAC.2